MTRRAYAIGFLALGLTIIAVGSWVCAGVDSSWAGNSFETIELLLAAGLACAYIGLVSSIVLEGLEAGALTSATKAATFSGLMHFVRIFGGAVGAAAMTRFVAVREQFHSNLLGLHVQAGDWLTEERLRILGGGVLPGSSGSEEAQFRAIGLLSQQVHAQAYTMGIADGFVVVGWVVAAYLLLMLLLRPGKISYGDLRKMK